MESRYEFIVTWLRDECTGGSLFDDGGTVYKDADPSTFEYLGGDIGSPNNAYAKDKNYFFGDTGILSQTVTPQTCQADFFKECLPRIYASTSTLPK